MALLLARLRLGLDNLAASGVLAFGMMFRSILVMIAVNDGRLALSAALLYTAAYTLELGVSFVEYFGAEARR